MSFFEGVKDLFGILDDAEDFEEAAKKELLMAERIAKSVARYGERFQRKVERLKDKTITMNAAEEFFELEDDIRDLTGLKDIEERVWEGLKKVQQWKEKWEELRNKARREVGETFDADRAIRSIRKVESVLNKTLVDNRKAIKQMDEFTERVRKAKRNKRIIDAAIIGGGVLAGVASVAAAFAVSGFAGALTGAIVANIGKAVSELSSARRDTAESKRKIRNAD
jgi:hypothetical protein